MGEQRPYPGTRLFMVRLWVEDVGENQEPRVEWRGKVQQVDSGEIRYFRGWPAMIELLRALADDLERRALPDQAAAET